MESWRQVSHWNPGARRFLVLSKDLPGLCPPCAGWVAGRRWRAGALAVAPFVGGALVAGMGGMVPAVLTGLYGLALVRAGTYGFADRFLWGDELEARTGHLHPRHADGAPGRIRFPGSLAQGAARLASAAALGLVLALTGVSLRGAAQAEPPPGADLALLSRPSKVWVVVAGAGTDFAVSDRNGQGAAIAYTTLEAVPVGPALLVSPHDALERALGDPRVELLVIDPGPEEQVVRREDFERLKLHLPLWPTTPTRIERP